MKAKPRLPRRQGALLSQAERGVYCLSANSTSNLILQRFLQRGKPRSVRRTWSAHLSMEVLSRTQSSGSQSSVISDRYQLFIFQEHYHLVSFIYLSHIIVGRRSSVFSSPPSPAVTYCPWSQHNILGWWALWHCERNYFMLPSHLGIQRRASKPALHSATHQDPSSRKTPPCVGTGIPRRSLRRSPR